MKIGDVAIMQTAPRPEPMIDRTIKSLQRNGIDTSIVTDVRREGCYVTWRRCLRRAARLYHGRHDVWILLSEDDVQYSRGFRFMLEGLPDPPEPSIVNLYLSYANGRRPEISGITDFRWVEAEQLPKQSDGALAYLMRLATILRFSANPPNPHWCNRTDHAVGIYCKSNHCKYFLPSYSLCQHLAPDHGNSALSVSGGAPNSRISERWVDNIRTV